MGRPSEVEVQDHSAAYYDRRYEGWGKHYHTSTIWELTIGFEGRVLDVGCGTGFAASVRPRQQWLGIDISDGMLARNTHPHLYADACHMPEIPSESFDAILCRSLLHHLPDHLSALSEMYRVLKPGGRIAFWETHAGWLAQRVRRLTQHGDRFSEYHHSFTEPELLRDIRKWFVVDERWYQGYLCYPLYAFPDIIDFSRWIPGNRWVYPALWRMDARLARSPLRKLAFAVGVRGHKNALRPH